ncbi:MAG: cytochrome c peroxidase [Pseudomonadota bacterium]
MKKLSHLVLASFVTLCLSGVAAAPVKAELPEPITPSDFHAFDPDQARIGQLLFYDKILSGNRNISCGTCHHHDFGSGDGVSLGIGEGGEGLGPDRTPGTGADRIAKRVPRHAPALWNLGHKDVEVLFHDGRLSISDLYGNGFNSPAEEWLPEGLETILAAQAVFPMTAAFEMAGNKGENDVAGAVNDRIDAAWPIIAQRVRTLPEYGALFVEAFDTVDRPEDVTIVEIANALAAFMGREWANHDSPFDAYIAGDKTALSPLQMHGMELFYGAAGCADCHSGPLFTDHQFHAIGLPAFGPGRTRRFDPYARDVGRMGESDDLADAYRFRTLPLRNVALTAPYGHNGAYSALSGMIRHHLDPLESRAAWQQEDAKLPEVPWLAAADFVIQADRREMARQEQALDIAPRPLPESDIIAIEAFLHALTGATADTRPLGRPEAVPSGLPVD